MVKKDALWKGIIEDFVVEFIQYFFSTYIHLIDLEKGFKFLDKELEKLSPQAEAIRRHADKLFQCRLKKGGEKVQSIIQEVQENEEEEE